jgi:predicted Holliday junction resolvase-like endonuclease
MCNEESDMLILTSENGASTFKMIVVLFLLFIVIHIAVKIVPMYMDYSRMKDEMTVKAGLAQVLKDEDILKDLVSKAKELDLPLTAESFILKREEERRKMMIRTKWDVDVHFLWGAYVRTFHFDPVVEEGFMSIVR